MIDATLLSSEQDRSKLRQWQQARSTTSQQIRQSDLKELMELDLSTRNVSREVKAQRTLLHQLQQSLSPHRTKEDQETLSEASKQMLLEEIRNIKSKVIPTLELQLNEFTENLSLTLCRLGNYVDDRITHQYPRGVTTTAPQTNFFRDIQAASLDTTDGVGFHLQRALTLYALDYVQQQIKSTSFQIHHLPCDFQISAQDAHDMIGCHQSNCFVCSRRKSADEVFENLDNVTISSLSLNCLSKRHRGKIYMQNRLPMIETCLSTSRQPPTTGTWNPFASDGNNSQSPRLEALPLSQQHQLELLIIYNSPIDSLRPVRSYQNHLVNKVLDFYQSLLSVTPDSEESLYFVRARAIAPHLLLPCEASRIVIEGNSNFAAEPSDSIPLGFVSNCLDFVSRSCQVKSRLRPGERAEFVYTLHIGWIVDADAVLKWMLRGFAKTHTDTSATNNNSEQETGSNTHASTLDDQSGASTAPLAIDERIEIGVPPALIPYLPSDFMRSPQGNFNDDRATMDEETARNDDLEKVDKTLKAFLLPQVACNPFDFLPLGQVDQIEGNK